MNEHTHPRWAHLIANADLTPGLLPDPRASWRELICFAGTFDGYRVNHPMPAAMEQLETARVAFEADGSLPQSLTTLRALLFYEYRADHFGGGYGPVNMEFVQSLVEGVRARVAGSNPVATPTAGRVQASEVVDRVTDAFERLVRGYARWGGYRSHGWTDYSDPRNFYGRVIWSERDCGLRFGMELERD